MSEIHRLRKALGRIADIASAAAHGTNDADNSNDSNDSEYDHFDGGDSGDSSEEGMHYCLPKQLPTRLLTQAAATARRINPVNAPAFGPFAAAADVFDVSDPLRVAILTAKYWGPTPRRLTVSFMEQTPSDLRARILSHMNAWTRTASISFAATNGTGDVRISRGAGGYYSYLGTDILHIPKNRQTMNLEGFTMSTPESEYKRVVRHETGHTLGMPHEHMRKGLVARIDPAKAYPWFLRTYGWDRATVDAQVLTPLDEKSLMSTPPDQTSIMCYQLPGLITRDGKPITGGGDINSTDFQFAGKVYPKTAAHAMTHSHGEDWPEEDDAEVPY
jgi:hypothetical protein